MGYSSAEPDWWKAFVDEKPARTAKLAVVRADGSPQVVPVWVARDGEDIVFLTGADTVKGRSILRDGRVSLCFDHESPPFDYVTINGTATTSTEPDQLLYWATETARRYMGDDLADQYGRRNAMPPEMVVRVTPVKVIAFRSVAD